MINFVALLLSESKLDLQHMFCDVTVCDRPMNKWYVTCICFCFLSTVRSLSSEADHCGRAFWQLSAQRSAPVNKLQCGRRHAWACVCPCVSLGGASPHSSPLCWPRRLGAGLSLSGLWHPRPKTGCFKYRGDSEQVHQSICASRFGRSTSSCVHESSHRWAWDGRVTARVHARPAGHPTELQRIRLQSSRALHGKGCIVGTGEYTEQCFHGMCFFKFFKKNQLIKTIHLWIRLRWPCTTFLRAASSFGLKLLFWSSITLLLKI